MPATTVRLHLNRELLTATALNAAGEVGAEARAPLETRTPEPGWLEQHPETWWDAAIAAIAALRTNTPLTTVTTISIESDFAASVFLDGEREVIRAAILEGDIRGPHPIRWLRQHQPIAYKRVQHLLQAADYLRLMLTGEIRTTPADAERTDLFDAAAGQWNAPLCDQLEINFELLPTVRTKPLETSGDAAGALGVPDSLVVR